jgi:hypothetical protein
MKQNQDRSKKRMEVDIDFKLRIYLKTRIRMALKRKNKSTTIMNLTGCSVKELRLYLESKFKKGMSWDNYGYYGWHIDHIRPCASFDLSKPEEQAKCFHYTNLQPLWQKENMKKADKYGK